MSPRHITLLSLLLVQFLGFAHSAHAQDPATQATGEEQTPPSSSPEDAPDDAPEGTPPNAAGLSPNRDSAPPSPGPATPSETKASDEATVAAEQYPARLSTWILDGVLVDDEEVVRGFLRPVMQDSQNWSTDDQDAVVQFLRELGYHTEIVNESLPDGSVRATLTLHPVTLVRYVEVEIAGSVLSLERIRQPLFADEIKRRMTIRPGSTLAPTESARKEQLQAEAKRLRDYLINDGFFEADVSVAERSAGPFEAYVAVKVTPGQPYFIGDIEIVDNLAIESSDLRSVFLHDRICVIGDLCYFKQRFSRTQLLKDVQELIDRYQKRGYPGVRIRQDFSPQHSFRRRDRTVNFRVTVLERRQIDVVFEGNESLSAETLTGKLTLSEVASYDDVEVQSSANAIRNHYQSQGYFEAQITWEREVFPDFNFERILFYIDEGPRLRVRRVDIMGNKSISTDSLRSALRTRVYKAIIYGDSGGYATTAQLALDTKTILAHYRKAGFRDAKVHLEVSRRKQLAGSAPALAASVAGRLPADGLYVTFHIEEGRRSVVREVQINFSGEHALDSSKLAKRLKLNMGEAFVEETAREDGQNLRRFYFSKGYPRAKVTTKFEAQPDGVTVVHTVLENSQARIGKIAIRGNFKTRDWVILDELSLHEGDLLTVNAVEIAQANLRRSGLFATVQVNYLGRENPRQEVVNVLVRVEERHDVLFSYQAGGGYSTESRLFGEVGAGIHNLGGIGARLDVLLLLGLKERFGEIKFKLPTWVMSRYVGTELTLDTTISYHEDETKRFGELTTVGGSISLAKDWRRGLFAGWLLALRYDYRRRYRDVFLVRPAGNSDYIEQTKVKTISSAIGPRLIRDQRRDRAGNRNPLTPSQGYKVEFRALFAEDYLLGSNRFLKLGLAGQKHWAIGNRLTLSTGLRYDHGVPLGGVSLLPEIERFFAGGDSTVRGYAEDQLAVEVIENQLAPIGGLTQFRVVPAGGNIRFLHNIDLQLDVWELWNFPIASALFLDTGLITNSLVGTDFSDLSYGAGVALIRWVLPVGSLSVQYAVPLTIKPGDNPRGRFHINLGVLFN